jgi:hypothetical protein
MKTGVDCAALYLYIVLDPFHQTQPALLGSQSDRLMHWVISSHIETIIASLSILFFFKRRVAEELG